MKLKFFSSTVLSDEELKKEYRNLSKKLHPDVGGDEEQFKALIKEYDDIKQLRVTDGPTAFAVAQKPTAMAAERIVDALTPLFTNTSIDVFYTINHIVITLSNKLTLKNMLLIEETCRELLQNEPIMLEFRIKKGRVELAYATRGLVTSFFKPDQPIELKGDWETVSTGTRYVVSKVKGFKRVLDKQAKRLYVMQDNKAFDLEKIVRGR